MTGRILVVVRSKADDAGSPHFSRITSGFTKQIQQPVSILTLLGLVHLFDKLDNTILGFLGFKLVHGWCLSFR
ncbi:hypothetical protein D3C73_1405520 [compost metagenome]